MMVHILHLSNI